MSLTELCANLDSTLAQLAVAREGAQDGEAIDQRMRQWQEKVGELQSARTRADWLAVDLSHAAPYPEQLAYTRQLAQQAAERLEQRMNVATLTEENLWVRLLQTTQKAADCALEQVRHAWKQKVEEFRLLIAFHQLQATASPLPQNEALLAEYEVLYRSASRLAALEVPKSAGDPDALAQAIDRCKALAAQLRFDAPKDVEEFFRAINAGGASLALVTPTVLTWLADNEQLGKYTVRSANR
jgi:hypothetical protein